MCPAATQFLAAQRSQERHMLSASLSVCLFVCPSVCPSNCLSATLVCHAEMVQDIEI